MKSAIHHIEIIRYHDDDPWDVKVINNPLWEDVVAAIKQMDNFYFPIVQLHIDIREEGEEDDLNIIGGNGRYSLFHFMGEWRYEDPEGNDKDARLWDSDQGYFCKEKNIITGINKVLRITKVFYETGSYENLDDVE